MCHLRSLGQQAFRYLVEGLGVSVLRWRFFVSDELAVGVDAESGECRPLQGVPEILECA